MFTQSKYKNYFANKTWYQPGGFSTSDLSSIEWYNMELIAEMEKKYASSSSDDDAPDYDEEYIFPESSTRKLTKYDIR